MVKRALVILILSFLVQNHLNAQEIREYQVKKTESEPEINGRLDEPQWQAAALTERFIHHQDGAPTILSTQAKFLWDDNYLYIGFICEDPDVWATLENRDDHLWHGEVVEILCDPDGDGLDYFEVQVNPLETILDLTLDKAYSAGGQADLDWNLDSIKARVWVEGTLNDSSDVDVQWQCEVALPFSELAFMGPTLHFPPIDGEGWRILVTRYDYERTGDELVEVSAWNQTNSSSFHVPERFGRIIFSEDDIISGMNKGNKIIEPAKFGISKIYPNPFNPKTKISFDLPINSEIKIIVYDITGRKISTLADRMYSAGQYTVSWDGKDTTGKSVASGIYVVTIESSFGVDQKKMVLVH